MKLEFINEIDEHVKALQAIAEEYGYASFEELEEEVGAEYVSPKAAPEGRSRREAGRDEWRQDIVRQKGTVEPGRDPAARRLGLGGIHPQPKHMVVRQGQLYMIVDRNPEAVENKEMGLPAEAVARHMQNLPPDQTPLWDPKNKRFDGISTAALKQFNPQRNERNPKLRTWTPPDPKGMY